MKVCGKCHSVDQAASLRQSRTGWEETVSKMVNMGAEGSDDEYEAILGYLTKNFGPEAPKPVNMNKAMAVEMESVLGLSRTEAAAVVQYRTDKGAFKALDDLKNVPGLDYAKVEKKKDSRSVLNGNVGQDGILRGVGNPAVQALSKSKTHANHVTEPPRPYSARKASTGFTDAARRAGT